VSDTDFCAPRPCPTPRTSRRLRNTLWVCPYCDGFWRQKYVEAFGEGVWYWRRTGLVVQ
jgi:hypothetical protein